MRTKKIIVKGIGGRNISGTDLKNAIYSSLEVIGNTAREVFMDDLEKNGIEFENDKAYSLTEIEKILQDTFGSEGASLVADRIRKYLRT
jgi:hypothetical protein